MNLLFSAISSALVSNVVLSRFLGICSFLGVSSKIKTAEGMDEKIVKIRNCLPGNNCGGCGYAGFAMHCLKQYQME